MLIAWSLPSAASSNSQTGATPQSLRQRGRYQYCKSVPFKIWRLVAKGSILTGSITCEKFTCSSGTVGFPRKTLPWSEPVIRSVSTSFFFNSSKHAAHRNCLSHITRRHNPKRKSIIYVKKLRQQMSPAKGSRTSQRSFLLVSWHAWSKIARVSSGSANGWTSGTRKLPSALQGSVPRERHYLWFNIKKIEHKNVMHGFPSSGSLRCLSWQLVTNCQPTQRPKFQISP